MKILLKFTLLTVLFSGVSAHAATPSEIQRSYSPQARQENPQFKDFSASRGEQFYHAKRTHSSGKAMSCASCHTDNPKSTGTHERTRKEIKPLAPAANAERFTDPAKVEKWFKRNCSDVLERACTAQEKGDFIAYLMSIK
jgi:cytochrome c peroxidase